VSRKAIKDRVRRGDDAMNKPRGGYGVLLTLAMAASSGGALAQVSSDANGPGAQGGKGVAGRLGDTVASDDAIPEDVVTVRKRDEPSVTVPAALIAVNRTESDRQGDRDPGAPAQRSVDAREPVSLDEIIVTAQKRAENLEKTPISITAFSGASLQQQGVTDLTAVLQQTPGVSFRSYGAGQTEIEMRGLPSSGGASPTVGFYLDETPLTAPTNAQNGKVVIDPDLYDLQRVEILRGPQGTLYGSGSMGGTVRLITNPADLTGFSAKTQESFSRTEDGGWNRAENVALNIAVIPEILAARLIVSNSHDDGWINRIVVNPFPLETNPSCPGFYGCTRGKVAGANVIADYHNVNDVSRTGGRLEILYKPIDGLSIAATALSQKLVTGGYDTFDSGTGMEAHFQPFNVPEPTSDRIDLFSLVMKYQVGNFELTSATSRWYRTETQTQDASEAVQSLLQIPAFTPPEGGGYSNITEKDRTSQTSEEIRIATTGSGPLSGVIGTFLSRFNSNSFDLWSAPGYVPILGSGLLTYYFQPFHVSQKAAFGDASYQITPQLKVTGGVRWYTYTNTISTTEYGVFAGGSTPALSTAGASASGYNPKLNLSYQPNDSTLLYANVAKGFRPGAGNFPVPTDGPESCAAALAALGLKKAPTEYGPDGLWSYELGNKSQFFDRTVTVNSAVYYESWQGVQQLVSLSCGYAYTANAGNAAVYGSELEIAARPIPQLSLSFAGGYTHSALVQNTPQTGGVKGAQLQNVPKATLSGAVDYTIPVTSAYSLDARLSADYVGPRVDNLGPLPSYSVAKLRTGLLRDRLAAYFYVNNITNKIVYLSNASSESVNLPSYNRIATQMPRTFGVDLSYNFGASK
jgi:iron complex outermembrane recepter protein